MSDFNKLMYDLTIQGWKFVIAVLIMTLAIVLAILGDPAGSLPSLYLRVILAISWLIAILLPLRYERNISWTAVGCYYLMVIVAIGSWCFSFQHLLGNWLTMSAIALFFLSSLIALFMWFNFDKENWNE